MHIKIKNKSSETLNQQFYFFTEEQWMKNGKTLAKSTGDLFSGKKNEIFITVEGELVKFMIGLGDKPEHFDIQNAASKFAYDFRKKIKEVPTAVHISEPEEFTAESIITGLSLGTYDYPFKGKHPFFNKNFEFILDRDEEETAEISERANALWKGEFACREWLNKPQNFKKVTQISDYLKEVSEKHGFKLTVYDRKKSQELGLGAFLAVNQGSTQDCAFTVLEYNGGGKSTKTVGLVGKCVLFDTGGVSIKASENMHYMKSDMGGATAVIGTLITAAERKLPVNIVAILPITDNVVSGSAYLPSDVITAYNGKSIEILNTDAEGRMTLADGLSYLSKNYKTDFLIDLATLTGSSVRMFGNTCGALFSNNEELKNALEKAGNQTNQRLWNMPLWDVWKDDFTSDVADFKNISLKPIGDCIVAAKFLEQFIEGHPRWAHLDIAGVAFGNVPYAKEKAATGYGVQLLINFLENIE